MRGLTLTVLISFALILGIGLFSGNYSRFISEEMQARTELLAQRIASGDWTEADGMAQEMARAWQKRGDVLSMWVNHGDVDDVSTGLEKLQVSIEARESFYSLLCAAELREALDHVYHRDSLRLKNIL